MAPASMRSPVQVAKIGGKNTVTKLFICRRQAVTKPGYSCTCTAITKPLKIVKKPNLQVASTNRTTSGGRGCEVTSLRCSSVCSAARTSHEHTATRSIRASSHWPKPSASKSAIAISETPASSSELITSLIAAAPIAMTNNVLRVIWHSSMMRTRIGNAVLANAVQRNCRSTVPSMPGARAAADRPAPDSSPRSADRTRRETPPPTPRASAHRTGSVRAARRRPASVPGSPPAVHPDGHRRR